MPKSKLKANHGGHAVEKGKGSVYQRTLAKRTEEREVEGALALMQPPIEEGQPDTPAPA